MSARTREAVGRNAADPFDSRAVRTRWWPPRNLCLIIGESPGVPGSPYFYDPIPEHTADPVGVRRLLLPALLEAGLIAAATLEAFRDAGFVFDHAIRRQLPGAVIRRERERALRYRSAWVSQATHIAQMIEEFPVIWVMGRIARNAVGIHRPALAVRRALDPPYVIDSEPRFFFSSYFRPRFDRVEAVNRIVAQFRRCLDRQSGAPGADGLAVTTALWQLRPEILRIAERHGARNVRVFGSVARGEADDASDIDFIVDLEPDRSLLDMGGLMMELRDLLGREIDVVTERGLNPRIRDRILSEAVPL